MTGFLKLISAILWVLNYVRQNPKKSVVGATGLAGVTTAAMFYGAPGVPTNPPGLTVGGTPSDGDVVTYVDPTGPEWAAGGGGGGDGLQVVGTPAEGDTVGWNENGGASGQWEPRNPGAGVIDVQAYGASGRGEITTTGTASAASTTLTLASASTFAKGQGVAIAGAGATHGLAAPSAPIIGVGGTAGAATYEWGVVTMSGDGGCSAVSTTTQTTEGNATLSATNYGYVCWKTVANNDGFLITGRSSTQADRGVIARVPGAFNAKILTFQAGGYTNCVQSDIGKAVVAPSGSNGVLAGFDNPAREWWVIPAIFGSDPFTSFGSVTITTGTGTGTSTAVADGYAWKDTGDDSAIGNNTLAGGVESGGTQQPSLARRAGTVYYPGEIIKHPNTPTGQYYVCSRIEPVDTQYAATSATATGSLSLGTTIGTEYQDGDLHWRAINLPIPADEPTAAQPDLLLTTIASLSGTTATLTDATTNAITAQNVWHNDWAAMVAARAVANASNAEAIEIHFGPGVYNLILTEPDADTFSQWEATNGPYVFPIGSNKQTWKLDDNATLMVMPTSHRSNTVDSGSKDFIFRGLTSNGWTWDGGRTIMAPICEPKLIQSDGWNRLVFYGDISTGASQYVKNSRLLNAEVWGFGRLWDEAAPKGWGHGSEIINCRLSWGGTDHDALAYGSLAKFCGNYCFGHEFDNSDVLYTNESTSGSPTINDAMEYSGNVIFKSRNEGMRLRGPNITIANNKWFDARGSILYLESGFQGVIEGNQANNGGAFRLSGGDSVTFSGNNLKNTRLVIAGGSEVTVTGGSVEYDTSADTYQSSSHAVEISGGTNVSMSGTIIANAETTTCNRGLGISGGVDVTLNGVQSKAAANYGIEVTTAFASRLNVTGGIYTSNAGSQAFYICQNASAIVSFDGTIFVDSVGNDGTISATDGTLFFKDCNAYCPVSFSSGLDLLDMESCAIQIGNTAGTSTISAPNATITNVSFSENPALTSITGLSKSGNRVANTRSQTMTALAANTDNLLVGICDTLALTTSGTNNYNLTGLSGLALGNSVKLVNAEASGTDQITLVHASTSSAGNQFFLVGATNYSMDPGDWIEVQPMTWLGSTYYVEVARGP